MNPRHALLLSSDLMIVSMVGGSAARRDVRLSVVSTVDELLQRAASDPPSLAILDLETAGMDPQTVTDRLRVAAVVGVKVVAFAPHVHAQRLAMARSAGCDLVLSRGQFHDRIGEVIALATGE